MRGDNDRALTERLEVDDAMPISPVKVEQPQADRQSLQASEPMEMPSGSMRTQILGDRKDGDSAADTPVGGSLPNMGGHEYRQSHRLSFGGDTTGLSPYSGSPGAHGFVPGTSPPLSGQGLRTGNVPLGASYGSGSGM